VDSDDDAAEAKNTGEDNKQTEQADEDAAKKERKRLRKLRKEKEASAKAAAEATAVPSKKTASKPEDKSHKSKKKDADTKKSEKPASDEPATASAEQWNPDALSGDAARKSKFLRLLGAGKNAGAAASAKPARSTGRAGNDIEKVQSELERQFEAGIRLKHGGHTKRMGLGA